MIKKTIGPFEAYLTRILLFSFPHFHMISTYHVELLSGESERWFLPAWILPTQLSLIEKWTGRDGEVICYTQSH